MRLPVAFKPAGFRSLDPVFENEIEFMTKSLFPSLSHAFYVSFVWMRRVCFRSLWDSFAVGSLVITLKRLLSDLPNS